MRITGFTIECSLSDCGLTQALPVLPDVEPAAQFDRLRAERECPRCGARGEAVQIRPRWAGAPDLFPMIFRPSRHGSPRRVRDFPLDVSGAFRQALGDCATPTGLEFCYRHLSEAAEALRVWKAHVIGGQLCGLTVRMTEDRHLSRLVAQRGAETRIYYLQSSGWGLTNTLDCVTVRRPR